MQIRANSAFHNTFVFNWMQTAENVTILAKWLCFKILRILLPFSNDQTPYFHALAQDCVALLHKSENQLLCFQARAHDFVDIGGWGRKVCERGASLLRPIGAIRRYTPPLFTMDKEPQWS
jgi:hypothetical protein